MCKHLIDGYLKDFVHHGDAEMTVPRTCHLTCNDKKEKNVFSFPVSIEHYVLGAIEPQ
jgi:hypothetical protein